MAWTNERIAVAPGAITVRGPAEMNARPAPRYAWYLQLYALRPASQQRRVSQIVRFRRAPQRNISIRRRSAALMQINRAVQCRGD